MKKIALILMILTNRLIVVGQVNNINFFWLNKSINGVVTTENSEILIEALIITTKDVKSQIKVLLNNSDISNQKTLGEVSLNQEADKITFSIKIKLQEGTNEVQLMIDQQKSSVLKVEYIIATKPNLYMVCVGVNKRLTYAKKDAEDIFKTFKSQYSYLFQKVEGELLVCPQNTSKTKIGSTIRNLNLMKNRFKANDVILLFFSSHGKKMADGDLGLETNDSDHGIDEKYSMISYQKDVIDNIKDLPCKRIIMIDACHSGAVISGGKESEISNVAEAQRIINQTPPSIVTLVSSSEGEVSYENVKWGHGAFTLAILEGLNGKADSIGNYDFTITIDELAKYVENRVLDLTNDSNLKLPNSQHPHLVKDIISDFPIFNYRQKSKKIDINEENCGNQSEVFITNLKRKIAILALKPGNKEIDWDLTSKVSEKIKQIKPEIEVVEVNDETLVKSGTFRNLQSIALSNNFLNDFGEYLYIITKETTFKNYSTVEKVIYNAKTDINFIKYEVKKGRITARFRADENPSFKSDTDKDKAESLSIKLTLGELKSDNFK